MSNTTLNFKQDEIEGNKKEYTKAMSDVKAIYPGNNSQTIFMRLASKVDCEANIYVDNMFSGQSVKRYERPERELPRYEFEEKQRTGKKYYPDGLQLFDVIAGRLKKELEKYPYCIKFIVDSILAGYIYDENLKINDGTKQLIVYGFRTRTVDNIRTGFNLRKNDMLSEIGRFENNTLMEGCKTMMGISPFPQYGVKPKKMSIRGTWKDGILNGEAAETYDIDGPNEHRLICSYVNGVRNGEALLEDLKGTPPKSFFYDSEGKEIPQGIQSPEVGGRIKQTKRKRRKIKKRRLRLSKRRF